MKRAALITLVAFFLVVLASALYGLEQDDFDRIVDFTITIKTLNQLQTAESLKADKFLILDGTVSNITIVQSDKDSFQVLVELVSGEWIGLEDVRSYHCTVLFEGSEFHAVFPSRPPRNPTASVITTNDRILVAARTLSTEINKNGELSCLLKGIHVRRLR